MVELGFGDCGGNFLLPAIEEMGGRGGWWAVEWRCGQMVRAGLDEASCH
jgi:hypothetical protein